MTHTHVLTCPACEKQTINIEISQEHAVEDNDEYCYVNILYDPECECDLTDEQMEQLMEGVETGFMYSHTHGEEDESSGV